MRRLVIHALLFAAPLTAWAGKNKHLEGGSGSSHKGGHYVDNATGCTGAQSKAIGGLIVLLVFGAGAILKNR